MKKIMIVIAVLLFFTSCSTMYIRPSIQPTLFKQDLPGGAALLYKAAQKIMPMLGYNIGEMDSSGRILTTKPEKITIKPDDCDCGKAMGIPVVKSEGIKADVSFMLALSDNELAVKADIQPELTGILSTLAAAGLTVACVSKGNLEEMLAKQFMNKLKTRALHLIFN